MNYYLLFRVLIFLLCSLPGLCLMVFCFMNLLPVFYNDDAGQINPIAASIGFVAGLILMLVGVGKWREWRYGLVFLTVPLSFFGYIVFDSKIKGGKLAPVIFTIAVVSLVHYLVKRSYRKSVLGSPRGHSSK